MISIDYMGKGGGRYKYDSTGYTKSVKKMYIFFKFRLGLFARRAEGTIREAWAAC